MSNAKNKLQEHYQRQKLALPVYNRQVNPDNQQMWQSTVTLADTVITYKSDWFPKKTLADIDAATKALSSFKKDSNTLVYSDGSSTDDETIANLDKTIAEANADCEEQHYVTDTELFNTVNDLLVDTKLFNVCDDLLYTENIFSALDRLMPRLKSATHIILLDLDSCPSYTTQYKDTIIIGLTTKKYATRQSIINGVFPCNTGESIMSTVISNIKHLCQSNLKKDLIIISHNYK